MLGGSVSAQEAPRGLVEVRDCSRHGFWGGLGLGAGGEGFDLRDGPGYSDDLYRPTISLRLGGTPSQYVRLGGDARRPPASRARRRPSRALPSRGPRRRPEKPAGKFDDMEDDIPF